MAFGVGAACFARAIWSCRKWKLCCTLRNLMKPLYNSTVPLSIPCVYLRTISEHVWFGRLLGLVHLALNPCGLSRIEWV
uniref:Uncharacterized protein n=1 Tax=Zea mays TaxID=4577 RepID=C0PP37_MAIZE|nr:unknown [Zea mays]